MPAAADHRTLLVSDLDGTLLRPDATLSETTIRVVNGYVAAGGMFTYATARSFISASRLTAGLRLRLPVITYGGAIIVDPGTGQAREAQLLPAGVVEEVLRHTRGSPVVQPILFVLHEGRDRVCWLADQVTPGVADFLRTRADDPRLLPLRSWSAIDTSAVFYISLISTGQALHDLRDRLPGGCHTVLMEDIYAPGQWWLELTSSTATKAAALATLKAEVGAGTVVCFGDHRNDLPMFAIADTALAVANAAPDVRAAATAVIGANTEDGVAHWISRLR